MLTWDLTNEESKLEAVDLNEWSTLNSPTDFLFSDEDQASVSRSRYTDGEQGRNELSEQCMDAMISPQLENAPFNPDEPIFSPAIYPIAGPEIKTADKCPSQTRLQRSHCLNAPLSEGTIQSRLRNETLPRATILDIATAEEAGTDYSQSPEARGRQACKQKNEKAKRRLLCLTKKQKSSHNAIERRYRNNLNGKIAALQKVVPSLQGAPSHGQVGDDTKSRKGEPTHKYRKAAILSQAIEYIAYLEESTERLGREKRVLTAQVVAFKKQLVKLDAIVVGSTECSQIPTGEILKSIQKSA